MNTNSMNHNHIEIALAMQKKPHSCMPIGEILVKEFSLEEKELNEALRRQTYIKENFSTASTYLSRTEGLAH